MILQFCIFIPYAACIIFSIMSILQAVDAWGTVDVLINNAGS